MAVRFRIASPCSADWDRMPGNDRVRYCPQCQLNVYNFSALSAREINRLVLKHEGRLCGRYYQRADGTMMAQNCPAAVRDMLRWTYRVAAGLTAALVGMTPAFANPFPQQTSTQLTQIHPAKKSLSMLFVDPSGIAVPNAKVTLRQVSSGNEFKAEGNESGEVSFFNLPKGTYELTATYPGFVPMHVPSVRVPYSPEMHFVLSLALMGDVVEVKEPDHQPDAVHRFLLSVKHLL
jgi:hypothetical protein